VISATSPGVFLRSARPEDSLALVALLDEAFKTVWEPELTPDAASRYRQERQSQAYVETNWNSFVIANLDGNLVGFIHWDGDFIHALHVASAQRRQGVGSKLLEHAEQGMRRRGMTRARVETDTFNRPSQRFYEVNGYAETDRYPDTEWNGGLTTVLFEKNLTST
jgi:GNAT superfamily N-acetyltransferase